VLLINKGRDGRSPMILEIPTIFLELASYGLNLFQQE